MRKDRAEDEERQRERQKSRNTKIEIEQRKVETEKTFYPNNLFKNLVNIKINIKFNAISEYVNNLFYDLNYQKFTYFLKMKIFLKYLKILERLSIIKICKLLHNLNIHNLDIVLIIYLN